jgi:hypothetical protein
MLHGFNGTSRLWRMPAAAIRRGSVFEVFGADVAKLAERAARREWLGERTHEGFGRFRIDAKLPGVIRGDAATSAPKKPNDPPEEAIAAKMRDWFEQHKALANPNAASACVPSLSQWFDLIGDLERNDANALSRRLSPTTAGGKSWKHGDAEAVLKKLEKVQPQALYARLFVRWLRAEMRKGAR